LDKRDAALSALDPSEFFGLLSRAEALAFQLRTDSQNDRARLQCPYVLLDGNAQPIRTSDNFRPR
jgi:hypothetical protein